MSSVRCPLDSMLYNVISIRFLLHIFLPYRTEEKINTQWALFQAGALLLCT